MAWSVIRTSDGMWRLQGRKGTFHRGLTFGEFKTRREARLARNAPELHGLVFGG